METRKRLGDLLVEAGVITAQQAEDTVASKGRQKLGDALLDQGLINEGELIDVLEYQLGIPRVHLNEQPVDEQTLKLVPEEFARRNLVFPLGKKGNRLQIAMVDPMDYVVLEDLRMATGFDIDPVITGRNDVKEAIERHYSTAEEAEVNVEVADDSVKELMAADDDETEAPIIRTVNQLLMTGLRKQASDVHLDPQETKVLIRYRIDGVLQTDRALNKQHQNEIIARIKIMANLNITEVRLPQDGRVKVTMDGKPVDLRISIMPTVFGEKVVIRILDMSEAIKALDELDLNSLNLERFRALIRRPSGMVLLTGPTGSGKTTSLYAAINQLNTEKVNIITIEDPVEYQMTGINQVQVNPDIGLTFANGLRSILRQDPNVVMVGEVRDKDTAEIAVRASLTGHLVFSTIHTNSAVATIPRLIDMGIEPFLVMSSLSGIVAQRLVRKVCPQCAETYEPTKMEREAFENRGMTVNGLKRGAGCEECRYSGYKGRMALHEILLVDDEIRRKVLNEEPIAHVRDYAYENEMIFLVEDGLLKAKKGETTVEEVFRVAIDD
ncbi:GspE/PulE family protein [Salisediminibacterium halotolerans]|uniref:GspE/PulE family protein n=1 Tax=Salisediminibacterium halotolerans TaxID=517425 RepID=UPI000EB379D3|nr:GspE/PulE family protein [Salisediminibacterium halotolerans]RLJ78233.1 type IV pilus assembly protein PilB [Actinophytocola xinjiangensis]RPE88428.1 type IV pilus assembly protein PilB [Salisediminibacterium halotolerans]TWG37210.1 type IV pilus assembly protein PilB [Salisediminibacterium halotolerans]GEL07144.1 type II secretion system protein E [Salisediminibacterium halotolerans]